MKMITKITWKRRIFNTNHFECWTEFSIVPEYFLDQTTSKQMILQSFKTFLNKKLFPSVMLKDLTWFYDSNVTIFSEMKQQSLVKVFLKITILKNFMSFHKWINYKKLKITCFWVDNFCDIDLKDLFRFSCQTEIYLFN